MEKIELSKISKHLVAEGKIKEALEILMGSAKNNETFPTSLKDDIILLSSRYNSVENQNRKNIIPNSELDIERNRISYSILKIIDVLEQSSKNDTIEVKIDGDKNIIINSSLNIQGDFHIGDQIKNDVKYVESQLQQRSKIKILFLSSNPLDSNPLRLDKEMRNIETELVRSKNRDSFEFIKFSAVRIKDLQDALLNYSPNFVHFSGHGNSNGIALLDNQTDKVQIVQSEPLSNLFKLFSNDVACVFLNSCYSKAQGDMIKRYIPNVIGMKKEVPDDTAIEFATVFYKGIGAGREIGFSFELAKNSIDLNNIVGSNIPELL